MEVPMTNEFLVLRKEIVLLDEADFIAHGGECVRFGSVDGDAVRLIAVGSRESIRQLARRIIAHHTAAR
jgi:hypothetical protein